MGELQEKARFACRDKVTAETKVCKDKTFTGYKVSYETLPDKRRRCNIHLIGVSGGRRLAVSGDEEVAGSGRYAYKKVKEFNIGPPIATSRICEVRQWCEKLGAKSD